MTNEEILQSLYTVLDFIAEEYEDNSFNPEGEWLAVEARAPYQKLIDVICSIDDTLYLEERLRGVENELMDLIHPE